MGKTLYWCSPIKIHHSYIGIKTSWVSWTVERFLHSIKPRDLKLCKHHEIGKVHRSLSYYMISCIHSCILNLVSLPDLSNNNFLQLLKITEMVLGKGRCVHRRSFLRHTEREVKLSP